MIITYTNHFYFNNRIFAYRKKLLFDITDTPKALFCISNKGFWGYWIGNEWLNENKIKDYIIKKEIKKDVSHLDQCIQDNLNNVFI